MSKSLKVVYAESKSERIFRNVVNFRNVGGILLIECCDKIYPINEDEVYNYSWV